VGVGNGDPPRPFSPMAPGIVGRAKGKMTKALTSRKSNEKGHGHEQYVQHHQPGIHRRQLFVGAHPHSCVLGPVGWRGWRVPSKVLFLVPFKLGLSVVRVTVVVLRGDREGEEKDRDGEFLDGQGALHPWDRRKEGGWKTSGGVDESSPRRPCYIYILEDSVPSPYTRVLFSSRL